MSYSDCTRCGGKFRVPSGGDGTFTSITVSYHDADREDWSESFCPECADDILEGAR